MFLKIQWPWRQINKTKTTKSNSSWLHWWKGIGSIKVQCIMISFSCIHSQNCPLPLMQPLKFDPYKISITKAMECKTIKKKKTWKKLTFYLKFTNFALIKAQFKFVTFSRSSFTFLASFIISMDKVAVFPWFFSFWEGMTKYFQRNWEMFIH